MPVRLALIMGCIILGAAHATARGISLQGRVVSASTGAPLSLASVQVVDVFTGTIANDDGYFALRFRLEPLVFVALGANPQSPHTHHEQVHMSNADFALDAAARAQFVRDGHIVVRTGLPREFHEATCNRIETVFERDGNEGNNILPRVPELQQVYNDPAVAGALQSLLGPGYIMNPHRHCHLNPPGSKGQTWHKDCYVYDHNLRHPRFHWVLAFYYPQDTTAAMGPTGVMPGQHWYRTISDADPAQATEREQALVGAAGTVSIVHFDAWHRATPNSSERKRYML
ncbi:MAG: phytanoyl-CoA dioxygenase family protein, partial [bacterium]|nr:phytanoyl-CoA dioxygenase family protein [bacterium]